MSHRFLVPTDTVAVGDTVMLPPEEASHARRVLRLRVGDAVAIFDGRGTEYLAVLNHVGSAVSVLVTSRVDVVNEPAVALVLVQAVLKGDKMEDVVRDAVMIGITRIVPVVTDRTESSLAILARGHREERWRRVAVASAKQCGRSLVPDISPACLFEADAAWFARHELPSPRLFLCEPSIVAGVTALGHVPRPSTPTATIVAGPEGGWSPRECAAVLVACTPVSLGPLTLRADRAALAASAALLALWE